MTVKDILKIIDRETNVQIKEGRYFVNRGLPAALLHMENGTDEEKERLQKEVIGIEGRIYDAFWSLRKRVADIILKIE